MVRWSGWRSIDRAWTAWRGRFRATTSSLWWTAPSGSDSALGVAALLLPSPLFRSLPPPLPLAPDSLFE
eukprot:920222-Pyramimonas_sp.AAC.1